MISKLLEILIQFTILSIPLFFISKQKRMNSGVFLALFATVAFGSYFMIYLPTIWPILSIIKLNYNWNGKTYAILFGILFLILFRKLALHDYYLTVTQNRGSIFRSILLTVGLISFSVLIEIIFPSHKRSFSSETFLFQLTLPGLHEEFIYRGIALGLLNHAFIKKYRFWNIEFGWALIFSSLLFGLGHGISIGNDLHFRFNLMSLVTILATGFVGFILGLIAENSGSILIPIFAHNLFNTTSEILKVLR